MKRMMLMTVAIVSVGVLSACEYSENPPLLFGQRHTVGLSIGGSAPEQGAHLDLGYKDWNFAIIPVTVTQNDTGKVTQLNAYANANLGDVESSAGVQDTLSVFGQFSLGAQAEKVEVGLDKFFATGLAARILAEGFRGKLSQQPVAP